MTVEPSYLAMLKQIATGEAHSYPWVTAWADTTPDPQVREALSTWAIREGEHAMSFAKRVNEMGFEFRIADDPKAEDRLAWARSDRSDVEKFKTYDFDKPLAEGPDSYDELFHDHSIDPLTGQLLGRFIAEERDTIRLLKQSCASLLARESAPATHARDRVAAR